MANSLYGKARRGLSLLLAAFMLFGCLGVTALAEEDPTTEEQTEAVQPAETVEPEENAQEPGEQPEAPEEEPGEQPEAPEEEPGEQPEEPEEEPGEQPEAPEEESGEQPEEPGEEPLEEIGTEKSNNAGAGYYLVGDPIGWSVQDQYKFTQKTSDSPEEYMKYYGNLTGGQYKVVYSSNGSDATTWYPDGGNVSLDGGSQYIFFSPSYHDSSSWKGGHIYTTRLLDGYYLIGRNGFDVSNLTDADKFSDSTDDQGQHTLTTTLTAGQEIKVVKVQNSTITAWYPDQGGNYTVDAAHAGNKTIYFKSTYNSDWSAFGGHIWISTAYEDGYYLIKNGWTVDYIDFTNGKFSQNPDDASEFMLSTTLAQGDRIKVVKVESGAIPDGRWYPNGAGTEYTVDASHSGSVTIYFRKDYQSSWANPFGGYFYIVAGGSVSIPDGYYMIGSRHNWNVANLTLADKVYDNRAYREYPNYPGIDHEWMRLVHLNDGETIKVVHVENGRITQWYGVDHPINGTYVGNQFLFFMEALGHGRGNNSWIAGDWQWNIGKRFSVQRGYQTSVAQGTASSYERGTLVKSPENAKQEQYPAYSYRLSNGSVTVNTGTAYDADDYQYGSNVPSPNDVYNLYLGQTISMVVTPDDGYEVQGPVVVRKSDGTTFNANYDASTNKITFTMVASDLTVIINLVPKVYNVTVVQPNPVWGKNGANKSTAAKDETVTVTAVPYGGCELLGLPIVTRDDTGAAVEVRVENGAYVFTMPAADVTVSALYEWVFRSCNLELSGEIGVNMYVYLRDVNNTDNFGIPAANRTPEKLYVTFDIHLKDGTTVTKTVKYDPDFKSVSGTLYGFTCYENVLQLASSFTATLHYIGKDNAEHTVVRNYSAPKYLDTINSMSASDAKDLVKAIADYGYYAQQYMFEIHSGYSAKFDQMPVHYTNSYSYDDVKAAVEPKRMRAYYSTDYASVSFQILLESATAIKVFITPQNGAVLSAFTIDGEDYTPSVDGSGRYVVTISGIGAGMLGHLYDIRAKATKTDAGTGEETTSDVKIYVSGLSYAYKVLAEQAGSETAAAKNAMCAMYQYYVKAKEYAEAHSN